MYGYIRPVKGELKVSEYERYRGVYCGLCHCLKKRYGIPGRFLVSYDFTFLIMLLSDECTEEKIKRCPYHPLKRGISCPCGGAVFDTAADETVILAWWKLTDGIADSGFFKKLLYGLLRIIFYPAYRKALKRCPAFADVCEEKLSSLAALEAEKSASLDAVADCFASILRAMCAEEKNADRCRILEEFLYHLGRIVYLLDAVDDLPDDMRHNNYNPLIYRFSPSDTLSEPDRETVRRLLQHSHNSLSSAFVLLKENSYTAILSNIIYLGLPAVAGQVFAGKSKPEKTDRTE